MKKIAILLILILSCSLMLVGCGEKEEEMSTENEFYDEMTGVDTSSATFDIVKNNSTDYVILIPAGYSASNYYASTELRDFIEQSTGVQLSIVEEGTTTVSKYISLAETQAKDNEKFNFDYSELNSDGFYIRTSGENVYIFAQSDRAVLYGAYEFVERFLGVRFLTADKTYVESLDTLSLHQLDITEIPEFRMRNYYNYDIANDYEFSVRMRMFSDYTSGGTQAEKYDYSSEWSQSLPNHIHNSCYWVSETDYIEEHPEWFASYTNPGNTYNELCYTNGITADGQVDETMEESVFTTALDTFKELVLNEPNAKFFMFGQMDDSNSYCTCEKCQASDALNGGKSGTMTVFMNNLAREIKLWAEEEGLDREINLVYFAYQYTEQPPVTEVDGTYIPANDNVILEDNLIIRVAPIGADYSVALNSDEQLASYQKIFKGWSAVSSNFMVWDYNVNYQEYYWYFPNLSYLKSNLEYYKEIGTVYIMNQSSHSESASWQADLKGYIASKLYWHLDRSVEQLTEEFLTLMYGDAGSDAVNSFITLMENHFKTLVDGGMDIRVNALSANSDYLDSSSYPIALLEQAEKIILDGITAVQNDTTLSDDEKEQYELALTEVLLTPQRMILRNYDSYYIENKDEFVAKFFTTADKVNALRVSENITITDLKATLGYN